MARTARRSCPRPLSRVAIRSHAATDDGSSREALFPRLYRAMAYRAGSRRCARRRLDGGLGGAGLLLARAEPCEGGADGGSARRLSDDRRRIARSAGARCLYRCIGGRHRLREARGGGRCQCGTGGGPLVRPDRCAARRAKGDPRSCGYADARRTGRRFCAGDDGFGRDDLHRAQSPMPAMSVA